ncbi:MAG TPA: hypothetical protein VG738_16975 [Chitinophagaceae bacterium]|nr:hypothetical protein [Chitinophagaceae bacterium]
MKKTSKKSILPVIALIFTLLGSFSVSSAQEWIKYASAEMNFKAQFPLKPVEQQQSTPTAAGPIKMNMVMVDLSQNAEASNMLYMINYSALPDSISSDHQEKMDAFFDGAVKGMAKNVNGSLVSSKRMEYKGFPGDDAKIDLQGQGIITARAILIHNRFYILMVISGAGKDTNPDVTKFFDSFESE